MVNRSRTRGELAIENTRDSGQKPAPSYVSIARCRNWPGLNRGTGIEGASSTEYTCSPCSMIPRTTHWILRTTATARSAFRGRGSRPADRHAGGASTGHESLECLDDMVHASVVDPRVDTH